MIPQAAKLDTVDCYLKKEKMNEVLKVVKLSTPFIFLFN